jgi:integrase
MAHSKARAVSSKLDWRKSWGLHPDFPLFPLGNPDEPHKLRWAKKVRGKLCYFGKVEGDAKGVKALEVWLRDKDDLIAGRTPRSKVGGLTIRELCNKFLAAKRTDVDIGRLTSRTFVQYSRTTDLLVEAFGLERSVADLGPADFESLYAVLSKRHGVGTLGRPVTMIRSVFKYAVESDLIDRAIRFGPRFKAPSQADRRKHKARLKQANGGKLFSAAEIRAMLDAAPPQLKAMILLGINGGLGNTDCATLPISALDLNVGWLDFPRPKTGIERRIPLWPETMTALREAIEARRKLRKPRDPDDARLVFLTRLGQPWVRYKFDETKDEGGNLTVRGRATDSIATETTKLLTTLGIKRPGLSFYALRHTFETVAGATADQVAVNSIMGHVDASMAAEYREQIDDERLEAVVNHVHAWLYKGVNRG